LSEIDSLVHEYKKVVRLPWEKTLAGPQKVWFVVYDPAQERRLRLRVTEFEVVTKNAGHSWKLVDLTDTFAQWMAQHEYREAYFEQPEDMELALQEYARYVIDILTQAMTEADAGKNTVVAVLGVGSLYGLTRVSGIIEKANDAIRGRLLVFFPGQYENNNYRLLDARDGWNYLAVPITAQKGI
jgi:hypothetical protein